jgi:adenosine deaminase
MATRNHVALPVGSLDERRALYAFEVGGRRALEIVSRRLQASEAAGGPVARLIVDIPSESAPESGPYTAAWLEELADPVVVAIGLGGPEEGFPRRQAAPYFELARRAGYPAVAHAGETAGADHVRQAVLELGARRVQHGVRAVEDEATVRLLAETGLRRRRMREFEAAGAPLALKEEP